VVIGGWCTAFWKVVERQERTLEGLEPEVASSSLNAARASSRKPRMRARIALRSAMASRVKSP
jgi:hypothetical protein